MIRLLKELRRRKVFRVAAIYAALAWVVTEVIATVFPYLRLPEWTVTLVIVLFILGFPVAMFLAWAYESTPQGIVRDRGEVGSPAGDEDGDETSIAVLPFVDLSQDQDQEYLGDGIAEELLDSLSQVEGLRVPARTSCFAFKGGGLDIREIGERLGVQMVLEGSVRKANGRLRVMAQLIEVDQDRHLWSRRYELEMKDIFEIEDDIAQSIVGKLRLTLRAAAGTTVEHPPTQDVRAYEYYLRGRHLFLQGTQKSLHHASEMFTHAIRIDPAFAKAQAEIALCQAHTFMYWDHRKANLDQADAASRRALELAPDLAEARVARALVLAIERRYEEASSEYEKAIELDPDLFEAHYFYARMCWSMGDLEKAVERFEAASAARPEDYQSLTLLANALDGLGRQEEAKAACRRGQRVIESHLDLYPEDARALYMGARNLLAIEQRERALEWSHRSIVLAPGDPTVRYSAACNLAQMGEVEPALDELEHALRLGFSHREWIENDADLFPIRDHPRFQVLLATIEETEPTSSSTA